jgi:hypothetical protein
VSENRYPERTVSVFNNDNSVIVVDDHCYVIKNRKDSGWGISAWIFKEALSVLRTLPENPDDATEGAE